MQFSPMMSKRAVSNTNSPKADRRASNVFLNNYAESLESNFAPAADDEDDIISKKPLSSVPKQSSSFLRQRRTTGRSKSPGPRRSSSSTKKEQNGSEPKEWVPFPALPRTFMRKVRENTPPRQSRKETTPQDYKTPMPEKKKKGFLRLAEEKVPDDKRFKNRNNRPRSARAHRADFIKKKFGDMDTSSSNNTLGTEGTLNSISGRSLPPLPDLDKDEDTEHFVEGLVYFAPTSESTIRKMTEPAVPTHV